MTDTQLNDYLEDLDDQYDSLPKVDPMRKSTNPVNTHHDFQRRTENAKNRFRKKERE